MDRGGIWRRISSGSADNKGGKLEGAAGTGGLGAAAAAAGAAVAGWGGGATDGAGVAGADGATIGSCAGAAVGIGAVGAGTAGATATGAAGAAGAGVAGGTLAWTDATALGDGGVEPQIHQPSAAVNRITTNPTAAQPKRCGVASAVGSAVPESGRVCSVGTPPRARSASARWSASRM
jgi:hypothetical protein